MSLPQRAPLIDGFYQQFLIDQDAAGSYASRIGQHYVIGTLQRLTTHAERMKRRAAVLALGFVGDFQCNAAVGNALADSDRGVRSLASSAIRSLWRRDGSHAERTALGHVFHLNGEKKFVQAVRQSSKLIATTPTFAETWNQRAIAEFELGQWSDAVRDCRQALEYNPYHFAAAAGMGHCFLKLQNHVAALECFRWALRLNPGLDQVRADAGKLQRTLKKLGVTRGGGTAAGADSGGGR